MMKRLTIKARNKSGNFPCDICGEVEYLEEHHLNGRKVPNPNHSSNLANICPNCHGRVHRGVIVVEQWVQTTDGMKLLWHHEGKNPDIGDSDTYII